MIRLLVLTLFALLAINCSRGNNSGIMHSSRGSTMTYSVGTQAELDAANKRINDYREELVRQGFREVSESFTNTSGALSNAKNEFVLEGQYGSLKDLQVTFSTTTKLEKDQPQLSGGIHASLSNEQAERDFEELYQKVVFVVTGQTQ